jgi:cyclopropane fatty-acyl-phospholipid synthase-like methyltransferase
LLHVGHVRAIQRASEIAKRLSCELWVAVQDDRSILAEKGLSPSMPLPERIEIIEAISGVDRVVSYKNRDLTGMLRHLSDNGSLYKECSLAVSDEYGTSAYNDPTPHIRTLECCRGLGIEVFRIPRSQGISSSVILARKSVSEFWSKSPTTTLTSFRGNAKKISEETEREIQIICKNLKRGQTVVDLGAGTGRLSRGVADVGCDVIAVEPVDKYYQSLREDHRLTVVKSDAIGYLRSTDDTVFDIVIASGIVSCMDDNELQDLTTGVYRAIANSGLLFLRASVARHGSFSIIRQWSDELCEFYTSHYRTENSLLSFFKGFSVVDKHRLYQNADDTCIEMFVLQKQ